ncbi:MAG: hypothetical protein RSB38_07330, partial [Oscillospiraceae bacterium]
IQVPTLKAKAGSSVTYGTIPATVLELGTFKSIAFDKAADAANFTTTLTLDTAPYTVGTPITTTGAHTIAVVTTHNANPALTSTVSYTFTIGQIPSANNDNKFNVLDYTMMKIAETTAKDRATYFDGGYFSGDVTGDFAYGASDYADILTVIQKSVNQARYDQYLNIFKTMATN